MRPSCSPAATGQRAGACYTHHDAARRDCQRCARRAARTSCSAGRVGDCSKARGAQGNWSAAIPNWPRSTASWPRPTGRRRPRPAALPCCAPPSAPAGSRGATITGRPRTSATACSKRTSAASWTCASSTDWCRSGSHGRIPLRRRHGARRRGVLQRPAAGVVLTVGDDQAILPIARSGSGARYAASGVEFWEHQGEASIDFFTADAALHPTR